MAVYDVYDHVREGDDYQIFGHEESAPQRKSRLRYGTCTCLIMLTALTLRTDNAIMQVKVVNVYSSLNRLDILITVSAFIVILHQDLYYLEQTTQVSSLPLIYTEHGSVPHWTSTG